MVIGMLSTFQMDGMQGKENATTQLKQFFQLNQFIMLVHVLITFSTQVHLHNLLLFFSQNDCVCVAPMPCLTVSYLKKQGVSGKADGVSWVWACKWMERVKEVGKGEREERSRNLQR